MKKLLLRFLISLLIGGGMLYLAVREIKFGDTWSALRETNWWVLLPYFLSMALQHFFRAWRWRYLLAPIYPVPFKRILPVASVGFFAIIALPLRMGELVRPYLIQEPPHLRMSHGFGTLAVERVFDGLVLALGTVIAVLVAVFYSKIEVTNLVFWSGPVAGTIFLAVLIVLIMALWQRARAVSLCRRLFGFFSPRLGDKLAQIAEGIVDGFAALPSWRQLLPFTAATLAYWGLNGVAIWILSFGFGLDLSFGQAMAVICLVGIGIMIPGGPGFIGNFELFAKDAVGLYVPHHLLAGPGWAYILTFHATNAAWYTITGFLALLSPQVSFAKVLDASTQSSDQLESGGEGGGGG